MNAASPFAIEVPASLLAAARGGDLRAFERLYRLFERPLYALAVRMLGDPDEAMEVVHDAMLKVFERLPSFRAEAPFWAWLRSIGANEALMRLRRRGRIDYVDEIPEPADPAGPELPPTLFAEAALLERALAELPETTRSVLLLYHAQGLTHDEIATLMGRSVSFSKSQLARGTARLRQRLRVDQECVRDAD